MAGMSSARCSCCAALRCGDGDSLELHLAVANTRTQATQATTDTSPSSRSRADCSKSVRLHAMQQRLETAVAAAAATATAAVGRLIAGGWKHAWEGGTWTMLTLGCRRICLQGHHSGKHHVDWCARQGLRRSSVAEEGAGMWLAPPSPSPLCMVDPADGATRINSSTPRPFRTSSRSRRRSAAS
jgi:hypothetical protein